jgi:hypothetical protein
MKDVKYYTNRTYLFLIFLLIACKKEGNINAEVYENNEVAQYKGLLYTTKYGGLNYYIPEQKQRGKIFESKNIDSIIFTINDKKFIAKSLKRKKYSRERNNSDFSFFVDKETNKIVADTVSGLKTILLFSERTDMELLKENGSIKSEFIEK